MKRTNNRNINIYLVLMAFLLICCHLQSPKIEPNADNDNRITLKVKWIDSASIDYQNNKAINVFAFASGIEFTKMKHFADSLFNGYSKFSTITFFNNYDSIPKPGPGGTYPIGYNSKKFVICYYLIDFDDSDSTRKFFNSGEIIYDPEK